MGGVGRGRVALEPVGGYSRCAHPPLSRSTPSSCVGEGWVWGPPSLSTPPYLTRRAVGVQIFDRIAARAGEATEFLVRASYLEIYNEEVRARYYYTTNLVHLTSRFITRGCANTIPALLPHYYYTTTTLLI